MGFSMPQGESYNDLGLQDKIDIANSFMGMYSDSEGNVFNMSPEQLEYYQNYSSNITQPAQSSGAINPDSFAPAPESADNFADAFFDPNQETPELTNELLNYFNSIR